MFGIVRNNVVVQVIATQDLYFDIDNNRYTFDWLNKSNTQQQINIGIYPVLELNKFDDKYLTFSSNNAIFDQANSRIIVTYSNNPKSLTLLKKIVIGDTKLAAKDLLDVTDWKVLKAYEQNSNISLILSNVRSNIRSAVNGFEANVIACSTILQLVNVVTNFTLPFETDDE